MHVNMCDTQFMKTTLPVVHTCLATTVNVSHLSAEHAAERSELLKVLAEPMRLRILSLITALGGENVCACEFPGVLGIAQPTASHHLKKLTEAGFLTREQRGKWAYYTLVPATMDRVKSMLDFSQDI